MLRSKAFRERNRSTKQKHTHTHIPKPVSFTRMRTEIKSVLLRCFLRRNILFSMGCWKRPEGNGCSLCTLSALSGSCAARKTLSCLWTSTHRGWSNWRQTFAQECGKFDGCYRKWISSLSQVVSGGKV